MNAHPYAPPPLITWTQNAAIFAVCANLFSTALANIGFAVFLLSLLWVCASGHRRHLDTKNFPIGVGLGIAIYIGWQVVGLSYSDVPMSEAVQTIFSERKICYILPLALIFSHAVPKRRFLVSFLSVATVALVASFLFELYPPMYWFEQFPSQAYGFIQRLATDNRFILRSNVTQGMVFSMCAFLAWWFSRQQIVEARRWALRGLAALFVVNIAMLTNGRSGYIVFLVLLVWAFVMWRGWVGVIAGLGAALMVATAAFYLSSTVQTRVMQGVNEAKVFATAPKETSFGKRMVLYQTTMEIIRENPLLGVGTGAFKKHYSALAGKKYQGWQSDPADDPHSQYLFILAENGLIGLVAFLLMIGMLLKYCLKNGSIYGKMAAGCLLAWCATSLFSGHFRTFPEGHLIAFIVGILMVNRPTTDPNKQVA